MSATLNTWRKELLVFPNFYSDLPLINRLDSEVDLCLTHWSNFSATSDLPTSVASTLKMIDSVAFPNMFTSLRLLSTLLVNTCECRTFQSSLSHTKNWFEVSWKSINELPSNINTGK